MIIRCNVGGSLTLANMGDLILEGGQIVDLGKLFPADVISRERKPPHGCLYALLQRKLIVEVFPGSKDHTQYEQQEDKRQIALRKEQMMENMRRKLIEYYRKDKSGRLATIRDCDFSFYDFLMEIVDNEKDKDVLDAINIQFSKMSDYRIKAGFILL